jgi:hypothetical protein
MGRGNGFRALLLGLASLLVTASVVLVSAVAASSAGPAPTVIGCSAETYPPSTRFAPHPHECIVYRGNVEAHYTEIWMQKLRWRGWGERTANARGRWHYCGMGSCPSGPLKAKAYRPISACGRYAYTRMRVHVVVSNYRDSTYWLHLRPC